MSRGALNVLLVLAFLVSLGAHAALYRDLTRPNFEVQPEMAHPVAYDAYAPSPDFPNGSSFQLPERGTIARGRRPLTHGPTYNDFDRAGKELHNPFSPALPTVGSSTVGLLASPLGQGPLLAAPALLPGRNLPAADHLEKRGAVIYANYCAMCHGLAGKGDGLLPQRGVLQPSSLLAVQMKDGELFHVLTHGGLRATNGWKNMPAHAAQLSPEDRWKVILHVRTLQRRGAGEKQP
jgi:mono/diheme cytochrome c family protein